MPWTCLVHKSVVRVVAFLYWLAHEEWQTWTLPLEALQTPVFVPFFVFPAPFQPWTSLWSQIQCEGYEKVKSENIFLLFCVFIFWQEMVLSEQMVVSDSWSVCVCEPFSPFLVFLLFSMSFFFYGAFSMCVSYLCICRLTFQSQSPHPECLDVLLTEIL